MAEDLSYFSLLICSHNSEKIINVYYCGVTVGVITDGKFKLAQRKTLEGNLRDITASDLPQPFRFADIIAFFDYMKKTLGIVILDLANHLTK